MTTIVCHVIFSWSGNRHQEVIVRTLSARRWILQSACRHSSVLSAVFALCKTSGHVMAVARHAHDAKNEHAQIVRCSRMSSQNVPAIMSVFLCTRCTCQLRVFTVVMQQSVSVVHSTICGSHYDHNVTR